MTSIPLLSTKIEEDESDKRIPIIHHFIDENSIFRPRAVYRLIWFHFEVYRFIDMLDRYRTIKISTYRLLIIIDSVID